MMFSPSIKQSLEKLGASFTHKSTNKCMMDLTQYFKDDFQLPHQKHVLNFLAHCNLEMYPPVMTELVLEYLRAIAEGAPEKVLVPNSNDMIVVE